MSCFIMERDPLCKLATWIESLPSLGFTYYGFNAPDSVRDFVTECYKAAARNHEQTSHEQTASEVYRCLYNLNARAYAGRYKDVETPLYPFLPFRPIVAYERPEYYGVVAHGHNERHYKPMPWHYTMCKRLDCLIYQCSEDATRDDPLLSALRDLSARLKEFIVESSADWITAD